MPLDNPCCYKLDSASQIRFAESDEVFPGVQLGRIGHGDRYAIVVGGLVAVRVESGLADHLAHFYEHTWGEHRKGNPNIVALYNNWLDNLPGLANVFNEPVSRATLQLFAATGTLPANPPPPPSRPTIIPGAPRPPYLSTTYGHLPFQDKTTPFDIYFRFEPWPTSQRVLIPTKEIRPGTFASPSSELPFLPTGFAAVARNALPCLFPAVFRYELAPVDNTDILCGAIVPMFGMSGGGVEVMFINDDPWTSNRGAIADPAVISPL